MNSYRTLLLLLHIFVNAKRIHAENTEQVRNYLKIHLSISLYLQKISSIIHIVSGLQYIILQSYHESFLL